jgi:type 1 glutamine amidotransferase
MAGRHYGVPLAALALLSLSCLTAGRARADDPWIVYDGYDGPGKGKHVVLVCGDEEYRSEELIPQLAKILAKRHGFKCTVLFAIDRKNGTINPQQLDNIPGLEALDKADLLVLFTRFSDLPDDQMKHIADYVESGKPIVGLRTSTHAFNFKTSKTYERWNWQSKEPRGGFGRAVLGETWVSHYGQHQKQSTRGLIAEGMEKHPIVQGVEGIWGPSDVYGLTTLQGDCKPLILGQVLEGMKPDDKPAAGKELVPVAWTKTYTGDKGKAARVFTTTMGHGGDFQNPGFRRLMVNACYWAMGLEDKIPDKCNVELVGAYEPNPIGVGGHKKGLKPSDYLIK